MHPSFHTSMRHDHASDLTRTMIRIHVQCFKKKLFKKVLLRHVLLEQVDMVVGVGLRGQQEGGGGQLLLLWPVMATEGASQSDFVPVTTGDPCGCPVGQGLAPHQPTLSVSLLWAPSSAAGRHILLQHTMMNFMTYFALFGVFLILLWNSIKNNSGKRTGLLFCLL